MLPLACHPDSRPGAVRRIIAGVDRGVERGTAGLRVRFVLEGDLEQLRIPDPAPPAIVEGLWRHTCCEIFVAREGGPAYHEFNLSPSGEWAAHAFRRYREGAILADPALDPRIVVRRDPGRLELQAMIATTGEKLRIAAAAVVEAADGTLSYWALRHPPGKPDFHDRDGFALAL
jgi:hypothetical protein